MINLPEDVDQRLVQNEWFYLQEKYPHVAFNIKPDRPMSDGRKRNLPTNGFRHLFQLEPGNVLPEQWDPEICSQFDSVITWNSKFYQNYNMLYPDMVHLIRGCTFFNDYYQCSKYIPYEEKIPGVVCINKLYSVPGDRCGHIVHKREAVMSSLDLPSMAKHVFAPESWGGDCYRGPTPIYQPGHTKILDLTNRYKFRLCFESIYHEYWSWDFMTERLFDCFKAKTVPIYWGCYNIEDHVPRGLFLDYRDYNCLEELQEVLLNMPKQQYIDMTERAFFWVQNNRIGCVEDVEALLKTLH